MSLPDRPRARAPGPFESRSGPGVAALLTAAIHGLVLAGWAFGGMRPEIARPVTHPAPRAVQVVLLSAPAEAFEAKVATAARSTPRLTADSAARSAAPHALAPAPAKRRAARRELGRETRPVEAVDERRDPSASPAPNAAPDSMVVAPETPGHGQPGEPPAAAPAPFVDSRPPPEGADGARPDYAYNPPPDYPLLLREQGVEGVVWLRVRIDNEGRPVEIELARGSGYRLLDEAALRAVRRWRFVPARDGTRRRASRVEFPVRFELDG